MRTRSKVAIAVATAIVLVLIGVRIFQAQIGMALIARTIDARIGRDLTAGLPDGLHVILCGTGSPIPDPTRAEACTAVIAGRHVFVFDIGEGGARKLGGWGMPMGRVERLFLTHFHSDHFDGLGPLMLLRWTGAAATIPLPVAGPPGVERVVAGFDAAYAIDDGLRVAHHGAAIVPPSGAGATAEPFAMPLPGRPVRVFDRDGVRVVAFAVDHGPVKPAVGYRIDYRGRSVAISGDTAPSASLVSAARGADVLVHEALQPRIVALMTARLEQVGRRNAAQITRDILNYHTTPEQAAEAAQAAGVKALLLTHIIPALPSRFLTPAFLGDARARFSGPITLGQDGTMMSLPAGSGRIETRELE